MDNLCIRLKIGILFHNLKCIDNLLCFIIIYSHGNSLQNVARNPRLIDDVQMIFFFFFLTEYVNSTVEYNTRFQIEWKLPLISTRFFLNVVDELVLAV